MPSINVIYNVDIICGIVGNFRRVCKCLKLAPRLRFSRHGEGGGNPINTSIELVYLFTIFYFPLLRERVRVRGLFVYTSGGIL